ncbi:hypothetical protein ACFY9C_08565 [Streptomyces filamentosus]|uniref:hypothetical protein n=1 Tax=Streptomyces filamentosus TaxID=67294 RepID=UPI0036EB95AD
MTRSIKVSTLAAAAAAAAAITMSMITPTVALAEEGPDPAPEGICSGGWRNNVYGYTATHIGKGPIYKDGPGGTIEVTKTTSETAKTSVSGTAGVSVGFAVAEAKAEISRESTTEVTWGTDHRFRRNITSGKYGNTQHGSWGHNAKWEKYYELPNCSKSQRTTGTVKIANNSIGFRYWETTY